jgi:CheY-like chemotaxis protein
MGGRLGVVSVLGEGSQFWVELPLPETDAEPRAPEPALGPGSGLAGLRVLLVEDNPVNMMIGVAVMEQWGVHVEMASDGLLALQAVARASGDGQGIHIVLMDLQMPTMSGHEAAKRLRELHDAQSLPIIALTAAALTVERDQALAAGMNDFLTKPIEPKRLHEVLSRWAKQLPTHAH